MMRTTTQAKREPKEKVLATTKKMAKAAAQRATEKPQPTKPTFSFSAPQPRTSCGSTMVKAAAAAAEPARKDRRDVVEGEEFMGMAQWPLTFYILVG